MAWYTVVVEQVPCGWYAVSVPALDGLATGGETLPHALQMAEEAVPAYIEGLRAVGHEPPPDVEQVSVALGEAQQGLALCVEVRQTAAGG